MPVPPPPPIESATRTLLDAYARADGPAVLSLVTDDIVIYGSDYAEVVHGREPLRQMLANDARIWQNTAHIGPMEHVSTVLSGSVATIFFDAIFSVGNRPSVPVRFAMVWERHDGRWLLRQSSNVVPTVGQSASEILAHSAQ